MSDLRIRAGWCPHCGPTQIEDYSGPVTMEPGDCERCVRLRMELAEQTARAVQAEAERDGLRQRLAEVEAAFRAGFDAGHYFAGAGYPASQCGIEAWAAFQAERRTR